MDNSLPPTYYLPIMASERVQRQIDSLLDQVEAAIGQLDWEQVLERSQAVLDLAPDNLDAQQFFAAAERNLSRGGQQRGAKEATAPTLEPTPPIATGVTQWNNSGR